MTVQLIRSTDRRELVSMLKDASDLPAGVADWYLAAKPPHVDFVVRTDAAIKGVITGTFGYDYRDNVSFDSLDLPPGPHAFLTRIYVATSARRQGAGSDLLEAFVDEALARTCTYVAGALDLSSSPAEREAFFRKSGFAITDDHMIGARAEEVSSRLARLRR
ncbi:GNAT family N-acetyltransferase [Curtobacterium sp. MWU13-2055]|uniref:GNAT family N-acetyltransferase n=1 Tax=Curtobacterium sp. MWU13-2055 TaxID=2931928 RepID=UPI00200CB108|nr:GNAT family N-acetyltransferase [Curtobacterium sp. MWU13-2055]